MIGDSMYLWNLQNNINLCSPMNSIFVATKPGLGFLQFKNEIVAPARHVFKTGAEQEGASVAIEDTEKDLDLRQLCVGFPIDCPWMIHGLSMDYPRIIHGLSMESPWIIHE